MSELNTIQAADALVRASLEFDDALREPVTPFGGRISQLRTSAYRLRRAMRQHTRETEAPGGLLAELQERAPRLSPGLNGLCAEHDTLNRELDTLVALLLSDRDRQSIKTAHQLAIRVRGEIRAHQARVNDLFFQAYCTDIGPCD